MRPTLNFVRLCAVAWACLTVNCSPALAQQDVVRILILNSYDESAAPYFQPVEIFKNELQKRLDATIVFRHVDLGHRGAASQALAGHNISQLLVSQYLDAPPHLVVAVGPPAVDFWVRQRDATFPDAPVVAMARETFLEQAGLRPGDTVVATRFSFSETVDNILQLLPQTSQLVLVFGDTHSERTLADAARQQLAPYSHRLTLTFTNDLTIPQLQDMLAGLPDGTAVLFGIFSTDSQGVALKQYSGLAMVRAASRVPVFGAFDDQLGQGIVGGRLIQVDSIGKQIAESARAILMQEQKSGSWTVFDQSEPKYDWRELDAWNIDPARLPPGSSVLFEPPSLWDRYAGWLLGFLLVVLVQSLLLITLLFQRRKRRSAELAQASLGRRLISAHEDERRLLARELHDDLSQRLARVAIDAGFVRSQFGSERAAGVLDDLHSELASISKDVHGLSYRIHPSLVDDLGLAAALRSEVDRLRRQTEVPISLEIDKFAQQPSTDVALCCFRIAQESLHNALKHAQASGIEVRLEQDGQALKLSVADDGVGLVPAKVEDHFSLGMSNMRERAALVNGHLEIKSGPGRGTTSFSPRA